MIGIDIVSIARIHNFIARFERLALERFLVSEEIALCLKGDVQKATQKTAFVDTINIQRVAGFWAAKEALSKALGVGIGAELGFLDIRIYKNHKNQPHIALADEKMRLFNIKHIALSISHDSQQTKDTTKSIVLVGGFAVAVVICT